MLVNVSAVPVVLDRIASKFLLFVCMKRLERHPILEAFYGRLGGSEQEQ